jgi:hypothetical protein
VLACQHNKLKISRFFSNSKPVFGKERIMNDSPSTPIVDIGKLVYRIAVLLLLLVIAIQLNAIKNQTSRPTLGDLKAVAAAQQEAAKNPFNASQASQPNPVLDQIPVIYVQRGTVTIDGVVPVEIQK